MCVLAVVLFSVCSIEFVQMLYHTTALITCTYLHITRGPVIGMSYGLCIWDLPLIYRSARNEIMSIIVCVIFGLIIGKNIAVVLVHTDLVYGF